MKVKVYGWQNFRNGKQTREVVAASSKAQVARIVGETGPWKLFNLGETWNKLENETAMSKPGAVFYQDINGRHPFVEVK